MKPVQDFFEMLQREDKRKWILRYGEEGLEGLQGPSKRPKYFSYKDLKLTKLK
jgi:hypothetical protein